jgi:hypothetical protein
MAATSPAFHGDSKNGRHKTTGQLVLWATLFCIATLLWIWLAAGETHAQPRQQSPVETATSTPDPALLPTETPDPSTLPSDTPVPLLTETPDPLLNQEEPTGGPGEAQIDIPPADGSMETVPVSPTLDAFGVIASVVASMAQVAAWIWFLCGSLIFFVVAGIVGGLLFSQRERHRYNLYQAEPEENPLLEVVESPKPEKRDDDIWPASLP